MDLWRWLQAKLHLEDTPGPLGLLGRERTQLLGLALLVGVAGGLAAVGFELAMEAVGQIVLGTSHPSVSEIPAARAIVGALVAALLAGIAATMWTQTGRPQGIPDVVQAVRVGNPDLNARNGGASAIGALLAIGGGQSAGREGPIVQVAATAAHVVCRRLAVPPSMERALVAAGAAAAIGASFNSPLGGAFFAMEALLGTFVLDAFAPVVVASVTGTVVGQLLLGNRLALKLPPMQVGHLTELLMYPVLGIACGLVTVGLRAMLRASASQLARIPGPPAVRPMVSGLFVGVLAAFGLPHVMGNGYALIEALIDQKVTFGLGMLGVVLLAKMVATSVAYTGKSGGGIFAPTLFIGAFTGEYVGTVIQAIAPSLAPQPGMFAVVGMGAVCAAVAHTPVTMALMIAEMTGNYAIILPLLLTIAIATLIGNAADPFSVYIQPLLDRKIRLDRGREELVLYELHVSDVMTKRGYATVDPDTGFEGLAKLFLDHRQDEVFVVKDGRLLGMVDLQDMKGLLHDPQQRAGVSARSLAREVASVRLPDPVAEVMETFFRTGLEAMPVLDTEGQLIGVVTERDVMGALNREILRHDALVARVHSSEPAADELFELPEGYGMTTLEGHRAEGVTVGDLDLQSRMGVTVLAVDAWSEQEERHVRRPVEEGYRLGGRDRLVLMGPNAHLERLTHGESLVRFDALPDERTAEALAPTPAPAPAPTPTPTRPEGAGAE